MSVTSPFVPDLKAAAQNYRALLKARDAATLSDLARAYGNVYSVARKEWNILSNKILDAQMRGEVITPGWLYREGKLDNLMGQVGDQLDLFVNQAQQLLPGAQSQVIQDAIAHAQAMTAAALSTPTSAPALSTFWTQIAPQAIQSIMANTATGGPVEKLLNTISSSGAEDARNALVNGIAQGYNPRRVAQELRYALDTPLTRAQTIARTEMMRAQRDTTQQTYQENSDVVQGYIWTSAQDDNTCEDCWALDGEWFDNDTETEAHINCRCTLVPDVSGWDALGFGADAIPTLPDNIDPDNLAPDIVKNGGYIDESTGEVNVYATTTSGARDIAERTGVMPGTPTYSLTRPAPSGNDVIVTMQMKVPVSELRLDSEGLTVLPTSDVRVWLTSGTAKFNQLTDGQQLRILGPAKYRAYKAEALQMRDFIGHKEHPVWGKTTYARSLKEILGKSNAKKFYRQKKIKVKPQSIPEPVVTRVPEPVTPEHVVIEPRVSPVENDLTSLPIETPRDNSGGTNLTVKVHLKGDGDAVVKPARGDSWIRTHHPSIPMGRDPVAERGGYLVAKRMGVDTPIVATRDVSDILSDGEAGGFSSVQEFRDFTDGIYGANQDYLFADSRKAGLFDTVIGNLDRHSGQMGTTPEGRLLVYDHGLAFPTYKVSSGYEWWNDALGNQYYGSALSNRELDTLKSLQDSAVRRELEGAGLEPDAIDNMEHRIQAMLDTKRFMSIEEADSYGVADEVMVDNAMEARQQFELRMGGASSDYGMQSVYHSDSYYVPSKIKASQLTPSDLTEIERIFKAGWGVSQIARTYQVDWYSMENIIGRMGLL